MDAICAAEFWPGSTGMGLSLGLREAGWNVQEIHVERHFICGSTAPLRVAARLLHAQSRRSYGNAILDAARQIGTGVFLSVKGSYLTPALIDALKERGFTTVIYYPDVNFDHPDLDLETLRRVDRIFTTKSYHRGFFEELRGPGGSQFLHHGFSPLVHRPARERVAEEDYRFDLAYVGNPDPSKVALLSAVAEAFPDKSMILIGHGWDRIAEGTPLRRCATPGARTGDHMAEVVQHARINIAVHGRPKDPRGWHDLVSTRTFEIPACKGFMLHADNEEVRTLFAADEEIGVFGDLGDLCAKIERYLARPAVRADMIERAYARAVPAYSYSRRAAVMAAALEAGTAAR